MSYYFKMGKRTLNISGKFEKHQKRETSKTIYSFSSLPNEEMLPSYPASLEIWWLSSECNASYKSPISPREIFSYNFVIASSETTSPVEISQMIGSLFFLREDPLCSEINGFSHYDPCLDNPLVK